MGGVVRYIANPVMRLAVRSSGSDASTDVSK